MTVFFDGPIVYINDDEDDQLLVKQAIRELGFTSGLRLFDNGVDALTYLQTTTEQPLLILSDVSLPLMTGLELRQRIEADATLRQRSIPFLFYTTHPLPSVVGRAYEYVTQGFHTKEDRYDDFKAQLNLIITYWQSCMHPASFRMGY